MITLRTNTTLFSVSQAELARYIHAHLPPDARILVHDAGYLAYATDLVLIDVVGLKTPESIASHRQWTDPSGGEDRWRAIDEIARREAPTHAVVLHDDGGFSVIADQLRRAGWTLTLVRPAPSGSLGYDLFALAPPVGP